MRVAVIGTGYVGLVAGTCFAESGNTVTCVDIDEKKIRRLRDGDVPIYEPGLEELLKRNLHDGRLKFTTRHEEAIPGAEVVFIAVGTPSGDDGSADLKYVLEAARSVARHMTGYVVVVDKSTVPVGTARKVEQAMREVTRHPFDVVSNPEFLKEGAAIDDFLKPDRVVIGSESARAKEVMEVLYGPFVRTGNPISMDRMSASYQVRRHHAGDAHPFMNDRTSARPSAPASTRSEGHRHDARTARAPLRGPRLRRLVLPKDVKAVVHTARSSATSSASRRRREVNERQKKALRAHPRPLSAAGSRASASPSGAPPSSPTPTTCARPRPCRDPGPAAGASRPSIRGDEGVPHPPLPGPHRVRRDAHGRDQGRPRPGVGHGVERVPNPNFDEVKAALAEPVIFDGRNIYPRKVLERLGVTYFGIGT
jgi:UDPglucose 6-dehydrogenase